MKSKKWVRPKDSPIAGVCGAFSGALGIDVMIIRVIWLISGLIFGTGICLYLICWFFFPSEEKQFEADEPAFLGVCYRIAQRTGIEVSVIRVLYVLSIPVTGTLSIWGYFIAHLLIPKVSSPIS